MKRKNLLFIIPVMLMLYTACISTYIQNPEDEDEDNDNTQVNSDDFRNSSVEALKENCATHESAADYVWENSTLVGITLTGNSATVNGSGATVSGNIITITSAGNYSFSGTLTDGQIIVTTEDTATVRLILNNVSISCSSSVPVSIVKSTKTIIVLNPNTINTITDKSSTVVAESGSPDGAIYSLSNLTLCGSGKLTVESENNKGIVSKCGLILTTSTIDISSTKCSLSGQDYVVIKSGIISITSKADGIKSDNSSDNTKGYVVIFSGTINITSSENAIYAQTDAIIIDGTISIKSGDDSSTTSSSGSKGIKGVVNVIIENGTTTLQCADKAILSKGNVAISGGSISIATTPEGANGIDSDSILTISGGTIDITVSGNQSKAIKSKGTLTLSGGNITIQNKGGVVLETSGSGYTPSYCIGIKGGGNILAVGSTINITSSGESGKGLSSDGNFTMTSGSLTITTTGNGKTYKNASGTNDACSASCISSDGTITISGGTVSLSSSGTAGKGINSTGAVTFGDDTTSPTVSITTSGTKITVSGSSSNGNGGFGGGPGGDNISTADYSSAKAIKSEAAITINNGTITISSADDGIKSEKSVTVNNGSVTIAKSVEAIESNVITINDGYVNITASDDGFNATAGLTAGGTEQNDGSMLTINGGTILVNTTTGDGIDSNGSLAITGGTIIVQGPNSSPELGMDINGTSNVSGGLLVVSGPNSGNMIQGPSTSSSQYSFMVTSSSIGTNMIQIQNESGNEIVTYKPTRNAYYFVVSSPTVKSGSSYSIYTGGSSTGTSLNGYYSGGTYSGGTFKKTFNESGKLTSVSF
jgi:trimeric autotransporter adhesin